MRASRSLQAWSPPSDWPAGRVPDHEMGVFALFVGREAERKVSTSVRALPFSWAGKLSVRFQRQLEL